MDNPIILYMTVLTYALFIFVVEKKMNYRKLIQEKYLRKSGSLKTVRTIKSIAMFAGIVVVGTAILLLLKYLGLPERTMEAIIGAFVGLMLYVVTLIVPKVQETQKVEQIQRVKKNKK